jgi:hypothetical protein
MNCPFCNSGVKPSAGLQGVYQHAENVDTCIIGDLGIKDLAAWNRRASPTPERQGGGEIDRLIKAVLDAQLPSNYQWGEDAMEAFNYGKTCAANALEAALLSSPRVEGLSHADLCRLSRCFLTDYRSAQDQRINEWLQRQIASALSLQVE